MRGRVPWFATSSCQCIYCERVDDVAGCAACAAVNIRCTAGISRPMAAPGWRVFSERCVECCVGWGTRGVGAPCALGPSALVEVVETVAAVDPETAGDKDAVR